MNIKSHRRNRKVLAPLATLLVAGAIAVGSGASFTAQTTNPGNMYATGSLTMSNSADGEAIFNMGNLKPGDVLDGTVVITNTGTLPAAYTLTEVDAVNGFVTDANLQLVVNDVTGSAPVEVFAGTFATMAPESLGVFTAGEARTYQFVVTLDQAAGNDEQSKTATATYVWDAVQTEGQTTSEL